MGAIIDMCGIVILLGTIVRLITLIKRIEDCKSYLILDV